MFWVVINERRHQEESEMRIAILADIHEHLENLRWAISILHERGADRLVFLGDLFDTGHCLEASVELLAESGTIGVWGNHDLGLCHGNARPDDSMPYSKGNAPCSTRPTHVLTPFDRGRPAV
jgi:predicted MPP superfamily phosphohydrolase